MKKLVKVLLCTLSACIMATAFTACNGGNNDGGNTNPEVKTGTAFSLVHGGSYVGKATVTATDGKITGATLEEMCLPTQVKAPETVADDDKAGGYYKTVKYGSVTLTYDAEAKTYRVGEQTFGEYLQTEANCKTYFEAAAANNIAVVVGGKDDKTVMTNAALNKDVNGYWSLTDKDGKTYSRWKVNRDATVSYVKEHGVEGLKKLVKATQAVEDKYGKSSTYWVDSNGVSTGATWSDMFKDEAPANYKTYSQLLIAAAAKA